MPCRKLNITDFFCFTETKKIIDHEVTDLCFPQEKINFDKETNLVYYNYRYYSPELGRWLSRDPIGERGGVNLYSFVINNVIALFDLHGLTDVEIGGVNAWYVPRLGTVKNEEKGEGQILALTYVLTDSSCKCICSDEETYDLKCSIGASFIIEISLEATKDLPTSEHSFEGVVGHELMHIRSAIMAIYVLAAKYPDKNFSTKAICENRLTIQKEAIDGRLEEIKSLGHAGDKDALPFSPVDGKDYVDMYDKYKSTIIMKPINRGLSTINECD